MNKFTMLAGLMAAFTANDIRASSISLDMRGDAHYSAYNFTDVTQREKGEDYNGFDAWNEFKLSLWVDDEASWGPYASAIPVWTSSDLFPWQRYVEGAAGVQVYPGFLEGTAFESLRLYAQAMKRSYYDEPAGESFIDDDWRVGVDGYDDTILDPEGSFLRYTAWGNAAYRDTNFSEDDYESVVLNARVAVGPCIHERSFIVFPNVLVDAAWSPSFDEKWWENVIKTGVSIDVYPLQRMADDSWFGGLASRFNVYARVLYALSWLGDEPPAEVEDTDYVVGLSYSTSGYYRSK